MNKIIFLLIIIILAIGLPYIVTSLKMYENYSNYSLDQTTGKFPNSQTEVLVQNIYPPIGKNEISNNNASDIWRDYPIFELGSYNQITNNIKYPNNPDEGTCMPSSMCGALYYNKNIGNNTVEILPQVCPNSGTRVGYFTANNQFIDSLRYRTDMQNILY